MDTRQFGRPVAALVALLMALVLASCSGDDDGDDATPEAPSAPAGKAVAITSDAGKVTGSLPGKVRKRVVAKVAKRVDAWFAAAWLDGDYPRTTTKGAWPGFTKGLTARARKDRAVTTNDKLASRIEGVTAVRKKVTVDILAAKGRAVGSTARFVLVFDTQGDVERRVRVHGRLSLTPGTSGWQVFGYDVRRSVGAIPDTTKDDTTQKGGK